MKIIRAGDTGKKIGHLISFLACFFTGTSSATVILSPDSVINNTLGEYSSTLLEEFMIDQSGLSSGFSSGITDFSTYIGSNPTHVANQHNTVWASPSGHISGAVDFDLGSIYQVSDFVLWNDANQFNNSSGIKNFNLYGSIVPDFSSNINLGSFIGSLGPSHPNPIPVEVFSLNPSSARYIRLEIIDNWGSQNINIHEVAFGSFDAITVPEPTTLALFTLGIAGIGFSQFRKGALKRAVLDGGTQAG